MGFDTAGELSGVQTTSVGGQIGEDTFVGISSVNPDCTGTMTVDAYNQAGELLRTVDWAVVFVDAGKEVRAMFTSLRLPTGIRIPVVGYGQRREGVPWSRHGAG